jgi:hypothetical protein
MKKIFVLFAFAVLLLPCAAIAGQSGWSEDTFWDRFIFALMAIGPFGCAFGGVAIALFLAGLIDDIKERVRRIYIWLYWWRERRKVGSSYYLYHHKMKAGSSGQ